jgi:hypothetical protein
MDVKLADGTIVRNVPDNITKEEFIAKAQARGYSPELLANLQINTAAPVEKVDDSFLDLPGNIPRSGVKYLTDIYHGIANIDETLPALGKAALGAWSHAGLPGAEDMQQYQPYASAIGEALAQRYGSIDAAKNTLINDPVGAMADASILLGGVGLLGRAPSVSKFAANIDPLGASANLAKAGISKMIPAGAPLKAYQSAGGFRPETASELLKRDIPISEAGMQKLKDLQQASIGPPTVTTRTVQEPTGLLDVKGKPITRDKTVTETTPGTMDPTLKAIQGPLATAIGRQPGIRERLIDVGTGGGLGAIGAATAASGLPITPAITAPLGLGYIGAKYFAAPKQLSELAIASKNIKNKSIPQILMSQDRYTKPMTIRNILDILGRYQEE